MIDFSTRYLGLKLNGPIVVSSTPLSESLDNVRRMEDAGASRRKWLCFVMKLRCLRRPIKTAKANSSRHVPTRPLPDALRPSEVKCRKPDPAFLISITSLLNCSF